MSDEPHLRKAHHLRLAFTIGILLLAGATFLGIQKIVQWRAEAAAEKERLEWQARKRAKAEGDLAVEQTRERLASRGSQTTSPGQSTETVAISTVEDELQPAPASIEPVVKVSAFSQSSSREPTGDLAPLQPTATVVGRVLLQGTPPPEKPIEALLKDPHCGKLRQDVPLTRFYVVGEGGALADVVIWLKPSVKSGDVPLPPPLILDQVGCEYVPYVAAVRAGQKIFVRNSDPIFHNVHATPVVQGNSEANKAQMAGAPDLVFSFEKPEEFLRFKCDVHPWMFAYVSVLETPYFAVTDTNGMFRIGNVPAGNATLVAHHRKAGRVSHNIRVTPQAENAFDILLEAK